VVNHHKYKIKYRPGGKAGKPDALSRRPDYAAGGRAAEAPPLTLLRPLSISTTSSTPATTLQLIKEYLKHDPAVNQVLMALQEPDKPRDAALASRLSSFKLKGRLLLLRDLIYVPDYEPLKVQLLQQAHDAVEIGHPGQAKTIEILERNFTWPSLRAFVRDYIASCDACQRHKSSHHKKYGLLKPLPIPKAPWQSLSMDHITDLPKSGGYNAILAVVDRLTKEAHFIPARKSDSAQVLAQQFLENIFRLHGLPSDIVSDRGPTFTSKWWKAFLSNLKVQPNLSTAFHPQSDGQTERVNQSIEQHLRIFCDHLQDNWQALLPLAEHAYNSTFHSSIGITPFYANRGYHPRLSITLQETTVPSATEQLRHLQAVHQQAQANIQRAQEQQVYWANKKRQDAPDFKIGDQVWLLRTNITTTQPSSKLDAKRLGPFPIEAKIGDRAYRLTLPPTMHIHPVFHVSLLERHKPNTLPSRRINPPPPPVVNSDGTESYVVEKILDSRRYGQGRRKYLEYFVHWEGYPISDRSWIPASELDPSSSLVKSYHRRYPHRPGP
jgi:hypothetical protein